MFEADDGFVRCGFEGCKERYHIEVGALGAREVLYASGWSHEAHEQIWLCRKHKKSDVERRLEALGRRMSWVEGALLRVRPLPPPPLD